MPARHVVYVPQAGDAGDEDGRRIGVERQSLSASCIGELVKKRTDQLQALNFTCMFWRLPNQYENQAPEISKTKNN